jgi:hypothetical protein
VPRKAVICTRAQAAEHVPLLIEAIIATETPGDVIIYTLDGHVEQGTVIFECTPPAVGVIMAALTGDLATRPETSCCRRCRPWSQAPATMS